MGGSSRAATSINRGLVSAFDSVGQNLFGTGIFGAASIEWPNFNKQAVQLDFSDQSAIPVVLNIHHPPDPGVPPNPIKCTPVGIQLVLGGSDGQGGIIDPDLYVDEKLVRVHYFEAPPNPCSLTDGQ